MVACCSASSRLIVPDTRASLLSYCFESATRGLASQRTCSLWVTPKGPLHIERAPTWIRGCDVRRRPRTRGRLGATPNDCAY